MRIQSSSFAFNLSRTILKPVWDGMKTVEFKKVLVTGGAGFIGSHVCERLLHEGCQVVSVDNFNDFYSPSIKRANIQSILTEPGCENFMSLTADIRNSFEMRQIFEEEKPDAVIHLAAMAGVRPSILDPRLYTEVNIGGTQNILETCSELGIRHMLFASSSSIYGNNAKVPFAESDQADCPISPYAVTKKAGELLCHTYAHLHQMAIYCLRFFTVYGPRQRPDLAIHQFARRIMEDREIPFMGDGTTERDYTYIDDIVDGVMGALEANLLEEKKSYHVINLGGNQTISLTEMVSTLEEALDKKAHIRMLPMQPGDVVRTCADISKAQRLIGYAPSTSFRMGIGKFAAWLIAEGKEIRISA